MKGNVEYTMIGSSAQHQVKRFILIFVILIIIYHLRLIQINPWPMLPLLQNVQPACGPIVTPKALDPAGRVSHTWNHIQDLFIVHKPEPELQHVNFPEGPDSGSWENRKDYLKITYMEAAAMRTMHSHLVNQLPSFPKGEYSGRGIVLVAGGRYSEFASTSLGMLRLVGSRVPVEVWMVDPSEERAGWCDQLAREGMGCRFLSDYIADMSMFESAYQYKTLVLLFSSFTEVLFLDSDNLPLINPDSIFDSSVYKKTGAVLWPDYWKTSESPFTPFITGETEEPSENAIAFQTVDSGMMLWNKQRHWTVYPTLPFGLQYKLLSHITDFMPQRLLQLPRPEILLHSYNPRRCWLRRQRHFPYGPPCPLRPMDPHYTPSPNAICQFWRRPQIRQRLRDDASRSLGRAIIQPNVPAQQLCQAQRPPANVLQLHRRRVCADAGATGDWPDIYFPGILPKRHPSRTGLDRT